MYTSCKFVGQSFRRWLKTKSPSRKTRKHDQGMETPVNVQTSSLDKFKIESTQRRQSNSYKPKKKGLDDYKQKIKILNKKKKQNKTNIPSRQRFPNSSVQGTNGSLPTLTRCPGQKSEMKKNSVFQFLSNVTSDFISLQSFPMAMN